MYTQNNTLYYLLDHEAPRQHCRGGVRQGETFGFLLSSTAAVDPHSLPLYTNIKESRDCIFSVTFRLYIHIESPPGNPFFVFFLSSSEIYLLLLLIFLSLTITCLRKYLSSRNGQRRRLHVLTQEMVKKQDENIFV